VTDDFRDPFSEDELQRMLGGVEEDPDVARQREFTTALWKLFHGEHNNMLGDGQTMGFVVVAELCDAEGNRWLRVANGDGRGNQVPSWQMRGYLGDALSYCDKVYDKLGSQIVERRFGEDDEEA
jgi:hypothetical protein